MKTINIPLGERSYNVYIGYDILSNVAKTIKGISSPSKAFVITNPVICKNYGDTLFEGFSACGIDIYVFELLSGEEYKTLSSINDIYTSMISFGMDRKSAVIAFGGGVVGDMAGFAAATYMRGIDCYQIPTTLLAMVDSSVGGKTGVDMPQAKNLIGAFYQPKGVFADIATLSTLPHREYLCGLAESAKYGIISDKRYFDFLMKNGFMLRSDVALMEHAISRSVEIKRDIVAEDEFEDGIRAILNFGHSVGHALEAMYAFNRYKHGEAVSIGMVTVSILSESMGYAYEGFANDVINYLKVLLLPTKLDADIDTEKIIQFMARDKKNIAGKIRMALCYTIGHGFVCEDVSLDALRNALYRQKSMSFEV